VIGKDVHVTTIEERVTHIVRDEEQHNAIYSMLGVGTEDYTDPGSSTQRLVTLTIKDVVANALSAMDASPSSGKLCITFAGGDDLMIRKVLQGVEMMTSRLNLGSGTLIEFRSLCHQSLSMEKCGVATMDVTGDVGEGAYWHDGQWWTVSEDYFTPVL